MFLVGLVLVALVVLAVGIGRQAPVRPRAAAAAFVVLGLVGAVAAFLHPAGDLVQTIPSLAAAVVGAGVLLLLIGRLNARPKPELSESDSEAPAPPVAVQERPVDRRRFLLAAGVSAGAAAVAGGIGFVLSNRLGVAAERSDVVLPDPVSPAPRLPAGADLSRQARFSGLTPTFTRPRDFYRVDTAITPPQLSPDDYRLRIAGMVDNQVTLSFADLLDRDLIERDITLACVSNEVGGRLNAGARWLGVPLKPLLEEVGLDPRVDQIFTTSVDGWTCGTPTAIVLDGRDAMLAVGIDREPLPVERGFPVRMLVPGLYGFVSATKWITDIELSTFARTPAYWTDRGWAEQAPVKTFSRIDLPTAGRSIKAGPAVIAGIAYAVHRGIAKVEVRVDDEPWQLATLSNQDNPDLWRQWYLEWDAARGDHTLTVRATDGDGKTQPPERVPPIPNGATGWQQRLVTVT